MSDAESFESVMEAAMPFLSGDCILEDCPDENDDCMHCAIHMADRLKAAHDREIRDTAQQQYHRGYEDGTHSMDAEHRAVVMRLRQLPRGCTGYSDAHISWFADLAWAMGIEEPTFASLRDELVHLMGGVSDENVHVGGLRCDDGCMGDVSNGEDTGRTHDSPSNLDRNHMAVHEDVDTVIGDSDDTCDSQCRGACAADGCGCAGEQTEVSDGQNNTHRDGCDNNSQRSSVQGHSEEVEHGGTAHDCADDSRGGSCGELVHMDGLVTYDVLDNERRKAVCELRKMTIDSDYHSNYQRIALAIGTVYDGKSFASECVRDRLIHLLGGDKPSGIDVLRAMDADGTSPNDGPMVSITDELREYVQDNECERIMLLSMPPQDEYHLTKNGTRLLDIADRIDAQFDRICKQQEAVLQSTIDGMVKEYEHDRLPDQLRIEKLEKQRDHWRQQATDMMNHADVMEHERDDACAERDELRDEDFKIKRQYAELCVERADLLALLRDAREEYKTLDQVSAETSANLHSMRDRVWGLEAERDELQAKLDKYERTHMRLPRDKDGIYINVADTVRINDREYGVYAVSNRNVWLNPFDDDLYRLYGYPADECKVVKKRGAING